MLWDNIITLLFLPMMFILWLAGVAWAIILPVKTFLLKKQRHWYLTLIPLCCITAATLLPFAPLPWHIWKAQLTYFCNRSSYREMIKNPTQENIISQTEERTVIAFQHGEGMLSRFEDKIVYISDDALPQKELFPLAESVKIYRKLSPKWYYVQIEY